MPERERGFLLGGGGRVDKEVPGKAVGLCSWLGFEEEEGAEWSERVAAI